MLVPASLRLVWPITIPKCREQRWDATAILNLCFINVVICIWDESIAKDAAAILITRFMNRAIGVASPCLLLFFSEVSFLLLIFSAEL